MEAYLRKQVTMAAFISHSQKDSGMFSALRAGLAGQGIKVWDPTSMEAGASLSEQLRETISGCDVCVFLATKSSVESGWCMAELGAFWGAGKRVIVFIADPAIDEAQLPPQLRGNLWTNNFDQVVRDVQKITLEAYERRK
jgi:hypothetical protein